MSFVGELRSRNVFRVCVAYVVVAWLVLQVTDVMMSFLDFPDWTGRAVLLLLAIGFPVVAVLAWVYELTPDGIELDKDVDRSLPTAAGAGRKLDFAVIGVLTVAVLFFVTDKIATVRHEAARLASINQMRSIAVLPFVNLSGDSDQTYFSDGISDEILNSLIRVNGITVASRTSSFTYRNETQSIPEIAAELGVLYVLEGSVRKSENRIRISAKLIDGSNDSHLWSETFDKELADIFQVQSEIANSIANSLKEPLGIDDITPIPTRYLTEDMDAYELYLRGNEAFNRRVVKEDIIASISYLEQAVALDPEFANGWSALSAAYAAAPWWYVKDRTLQEYLDAAVDAADRAISLDPDLAYPFGIKASIAENREPYDATESLRLFQMALERDPKNQTMHHWRGVSLLHMGFFEESVAEQQVCLDIDPNSAICLFYMSFALQCLGRHEEASDVFAKMLEYSGMYGILVEVPALLLMGDKTAALVASRGLEELSGAPVAEWIEAMENEDADIEFGLAKFDLWAAENEVDLSQYPELLAAFGAYDRIEYSVVGEPWYWLPTYKNFRASPQFKWMIREFGRLEFWQTRGFPPQCRPLGADDFECD